MELPKGILKAARSIGSFIADKNPKLAVFGNTAVGNKLSGVSNRVDCIKRRAGRIIAQDLKQYNAMSGVGIEPRGERIAAQDLKQINAMFNGRIGLTIAKPQQITFNEVVKVRVFTPNPEEKMIENSNAVSSRVTGINLKNANISPGLVSILRSRGFR
ncbi:hypothetical protein [Yersinia artesiana]|uniref:hypothetical protein n=1 Tax=Yersinia artesiana TaxID=2890315 RepID=UPI001583D028|nr:hypothetical protein [Yersinia artesiana]